MKKRQKSKMTMLIVGGLAAVSLVSVGFASWVISGTTAAKTQTVNVAVGTVNNDSLTATVLDSGKNLDLSFDNVESPTGGVLSNNSSTYEDLEFTIPVKIAGNLSKLNTIDFTFTGTLVDAALYGSESTEYLIAPWVTISDAKKVVYTYGSKSLNPTDTKRVSASEPAVTKEGNLDTVTVTFTFKFQWGAAFNNANPGNVTITSSYTKQTLIDRLNAFDTAMPDSPMLSVAIAPTLKPSN